MCNRKMSCRNNASGRLIYLLNARRTKLGKDWRLEGEQKGLTIKKSKA